MNVTAEYLCKELSKLAPLERNKVLYFVELLRKGKNAEYIMNNKAINALTAEERAEVEGYHINRKRT